MSRQQPIFVNSSSSSGGVGLVGAVFLVFLVLKLAAVGTVANWSWWWVTAPLWGAAGLFLAGLLVFCLVALVVVLVRK